MSTALAERPVGAPTVTTDQLDLIKRTVAKDATADELKLYLYDCARQGVHPLDKLIHFTKRAGKYTPITSIDFMRTRAADTGEYAGNEDAEFDYWGDQEKPQPDSAKVTVYRLVQGERCPFSARALWSEYCPPAGQDHMWKKMPHTMLAKCAEALALRKGFPRQLAGLYAKEEMDQAGPSGGYVVEAPTTSGRLQAAAAATVDPARGMSASGEGVAAQGANPAPTPPDYAATALDGKLRLSRMSSAPTRNPNVTKYFIVASNGEELTTINSQLAALCEQLVEEQCPVVIETAQTKWGTDLISVHRGSFNVLESEIEPPPLTDSDIPF